MYLNKKLFLCGILSADRWTHCSWNDPITPVVRLPALTGWRGNFIWMYICSLYLCCTYIPAETDHIDANLGSKGLGLGFQHDPPFGKFNNQFHIVKLHEPKKASWQTKLSPRKDVWMQACNIQSIRQKVCFYNDSIWGNTLWFWRYNTFQA